jgi:hypothetical protein
MKANSAFAGAARIIVLNAIAKENANRTIIHCHGDHEFKFTRWPAQHLGYLGVQAKHAGDTIELALSHCEGIDWFCH